MGVLYVGFKGKNNPSYQLVSQLKGEKLYLTNSFDGLTRDIAGLSSEYTEVYMFGIDRNLRNAVRIESCAEQNGQCLESSLCLTDVAEKLRANEVASVISDKPTTYLCNDAYYRMLERVKGNAVFIHIPGMRQISDKLMDGIIKSLGERR